VRAKGVHSVRIESGNNKNKLNFRRVIRVERRERGELSYLRAYTARIIVQHVKSGLDRAIKYLKEFSGHIKLRREGEEKV